MKQENKGAVYAVVILALLGVLALVSDMKAFDIGTMANPNVITLRD